MSFRSEDHDSSRTGEDESRQPLAQRIGNDPHPNGGDVSGRPTGVNNRGRELLPAKPDVDSQREFADIQSSAQSRSRRSTPDVPDRVHERSHLPRVREERQIHQLPPRPRSPPRSPRSPRTPPDIHSRQGSRASPSYHTYQRDRQERGNGFGRREAWNRDGRENVTGPRRDPPPHSMPPFRPNYASNVPGRDESAGPVNLEQRQLREKTDVNIWPASPERPHADTLDDKARRPKKSKSRRRRRYTSETDSESEAERRRRKERRREKERKRSGSERRRTDSEDDRKRATPERLPEDDGPEVGPQLPRAVSVKDRLDREGFRDLLPGEGEAMQAFIQKGERIPRRGEIGMDASKIAEFEDAGYVMSGNRHQRMNAVRIRKEGQVLSMEEQRAMVQKQREQKLEKEGAIISQFKEMMDERLKAEEKRMRDE